MVNVSITSQIRRLLLVFALTATAIEAQPLPNDLLVFAARADLVRLTRGGTATTLGQFGSNYAMAMDTDNRTLIATDSFFVLPPQRVVRIDPVTRFVIATVWNGSPLTAGLSDIRVDQDGDYLVCQTGGAPVLRGALYKLKRDGSAVTTLVVGQSGSLFLRFTEDRNTGDWIITDSHTLGPRILRVDRDTLTVKQTISFPSRQILIGGLEQDPHRSTIYIATGKGPSLMAFDPLTNGLSTLSVGPDVDCITIDRSPAGNGALLYGGQNGTIQAFDRAGTSIRSFGNLALPFAVTFDGSRNLGPELVTPPNDRLVRVSFPGDAGKPFVLAVGASGYTPGIPLPDGRVIPLNLDQLVTASVQGAIPPSLLAGNLGTLNALGQATVSVNLNTLSLKGVRLWLVAVSLDPSAPLGLSQISGAQLLVL